MTTIGFEVGSRFVLIDEFSPALRLILKQVRELNVALDKARANLAGIGKGVTAGLGGAVGETQALAVAWREVAAASALATRNLGAAGAAGRSAAVSAATGGGAGRGGGAAGGRHRPGWLGGGGGGRSHITGPGAPIPGGGHMRFGGGAMAGAGLLGYGVYEAAEMEDAVFQLIYHSGLEQNDANRAKFRKVLQDSMVESGYGLKDIAESAKQEIRMFQGTPGGGLDVLPEMLRTATIEARLKGEGPKESMRALIGLAHMLPKYGAEDIKKLAPAFAFLSTANPRSLSSIERAAGYAVPLLRSGMEIDPMDTLLLGTVLARAGATSTKSGTWLREMALRAMPGTSLMSRMMYKKHEFALQELGLSDEKGKPTWFTDGKPDLLKMLDIGGAGAAKIPLERRAAVERSLFGAQGGGGFALLADPAVNAQVKALRQTRDSPEFKNRYAGFTESYKQGSTVQQARTAMQTFNITLMDIARDALPSVNEALKGFKAALEGVRSVLPVGDGKSAAKIGGGAILGGVLGGVAGIPFGPLGIVAGIAGGGALGGEVGLSASQGSRQDPKVTDEFLKELRRQGETGAAPERGAAAAPQATLAPIALTINMDGAVLATAMSTAIANIHAFPTQAPAFDHFGLPHSGGNQGFSDK